MKKALNEVKRLKDIKYRPTEKLSKMQYMTMVVSVCFQIMKEEDNFEQFCKENELSEELALEVKKFVNSDSFLHYILVALHSVITRKDYEIIAPSSKEALYYSENFAITILDNMLGELKAHSAQNLATKVDLEIKQIETETGVEVAKMNWKEVIGEKYFT